MPEPIFRLFILAAGSLVAMSVGAVGQRYQASGDIPVAPGVAADGSYGAAPGGGGMGMPGMAPDRYGAVLNPNRSLQPGDQLAFKIEQDKESPVPLTVTPGGDLIVEPLERAVHVAGLNTAQASAEIKRALEKDYYYTATVRLNLLSNGVRPVGKVQLAGAVARVGDVPLYSDRPMRLSEAIMSTGGFGKYPDDRKVRVTRSTSAGVQTFTVDVKAIVREGKPEGDVVLKDGDAIFVPETWVKR